MQKYINMSISTCFFTSLVQLSSIFKVSFIIGSYTAWFSASSIMMPLSGAFTGLMGSMAVCGAGVLFKFFFGCAFPFKYLAYHIPGLFAAFYFASSSPLIRVLVPLICMGAFIAHPIGGAAWLYSLYWLIPIALYFKPKKSLFLEGLGSTFTAHAVGSAIWIYTTPMTPAVWLGLIPIVALERLTFASGMVIAHKLISWCLAQSSKVHFVNFFMQKRSNHV
jgi:hypothetical protein